MCSVIVGLPDQFHSFRTHTRISHFSCSNHEISTAHNNQNIEKINIVLKPSDIELSLLINVKMPTTASILTFMSMINVMLS